MKILITILLFNLCLFAQSGLNKNKVIGNGVTPTEWNTLIDNQDQLLEYVAASAILKHINSDTTLTSIQVPVTFLVNATTDTVYINLPPITDTSTFKSLQAKLTYNTNPVCLLPNGSQTIEGSSCQYIRNTGEALTIRADTDSLRWEILQDSRSKAVGEVFAYIDSSIANTVTSDQTWYYMNGRFVNQYTINFGIVNDTLRYTGDRDSVRIYIDYFGTITASVAQTTVGVRVMQNDTAITASQRNILITDLDGQRQLVNKFSTILRNGDKFHFEVNANKNTDIEMLQFNTTLFDVRR